MALFNKLFFSSSSKKKTNLSINQNNLSPHFPFDCNQVRILLYRECDANGRRLLFDSNSIQKILINENQKSTNNKSNLSTNKPKLFDNLKSQTTKNESVLNDGNFIEISNGIGYKHTRPTTSDITNIGELVFGALAMSFRSPSLKVHWLQSPSRLLCSQVFLSPIPGSNTGCLLNQTELLGSSSNSNNNISPKAKLKKESNESFDGFSVSSLTSQFSPIETNRNLSIQLSTLPIIHDTSLIKNPLNPISDQIEMNKRNVQSMDATTPTIGSDSGYATISDCWTSRSSYQYSTRSSMGSVLSDPLSTYDNLRKFSLDSGKSNYGDSGAINNSFGSTSFSTSMQQNSKTSDMSISRRIARNMQTSFENRNSICDFVGFISDNYQMGTLNGGSDGCVTTKYNIPRSIDSHHKGHSNPEIRNNKDISSSSSIFNIFGISNKNSSNNRGHKFNSKRSKLGLAVCISMSESHEKEMEQFCCEHIALLESMLSRLRASAEYAYLNHKRFLKIMLHAWQKTTEWILDFFTVPRLTVPVWYNLTSVESKSCKQRADNFIKEFCWLLKNSDSKDTNFFISTMITAVLTHHLGWVSTVTSIPSNMSSGSVNETANDKQNSFKKVANQYPYNPLWAQMCDLYGAIGNPPKVTRTIISGKDKNLMEKFLHSLTYFIRCGEVCQIDLNKELKTDSLGQIPTETESKFSRIENSKNKSSFSRNTKTVHKNLCDITTIDDIKQETENHKINDIPNILTFHGSRFAKHEFPFQNLEINHDLYKNSDSKETIKFTVTTPEEVEMVLDDETFSIYSNSNSTIGAQNCEALEAIEIQEFSELNVISRLEPPNIIEKLNFWKLEPVVKEGLSWMDVATLQKDIKIKRNHHEETNSENFQILSENYISCAYEKNSSSQEDKNMSLSNLITENSVGKSERFVWGIEPIKENVCLEEEKHFEVSQKIVEKDRNFISTKNEIVNQEKGKGVLFVLGENEHLVNIKKSNENLFSEEKISKRESPTGNHHRKYSGVKFDLEEYSENATKFLNKKIYFEKSIYDFPPKRSPKIEKPLYNDFWTKCTCDSNNDIPSTSESSFDLNKNNKSNNDLKNYKTSSYACEFCKSKTENVKTNDTNVYKMQDEIKKDVSEKIKLPNNGNISRKNSNSSPIKKLELKDENINCLPMSSRGLHLKKMFQNLKEKTKKLENVNLKILPIPEIDNSNDNVNLSHFNNDKSNNFKTGFIPSLFVGVSDRYIPDMVLQGTVSPISKWETSIKNDLTIASHCASLISQPTENIAIIADMDKWEIKILSSQSNVLPHTIIPSNEQIGMSQLVSQLLEGFYIMSNSGVSSYECLAYLESKLKEIYLQSKVLAGLLLTTEFCSLNSVTTALNLSENDVPLLLAIASIHSPQVTKRYGISFG